jgi:phage gpG-like protein
MSFAGLLGAGLLGGVANSAKGVGDKIREEAKQKRAMALVDQAQVNAVAIQTQADDAQSARDDVGYTAAIDLANVKSANRTSELTVSGQINKDLTLSSQNNLALIANAAADKAQGFVGINQDQLAAIAKAQLKLKNKLEAATASQTASNLQASQVAQQELTALINSTAEALKVTTDAAAVAEKVTTDAAVVDKATVVAADVASTLASTDAATQAAAAAFAAGTAEVAQNYDMAKLSKTGKQQLQLLNREYELRVQAAIDSKVGDIETFYDETTGRNQKWEKTASGWEKRGGNQAPDASTSKGLTLQVAYNDKGEEVKGYMNGTEFVQVGAAKAAKADTPAEARTYFTGQAKFILGGSPSAFLKAKLTDDDANLMSEWISEAEAAFADNPNMSLSQIVKNIMFKPWVLDELDITDADITAGEQEASTAANTTGATVLEPMDYARQIAQKRQPDFIKAQEKYDAFVANNKDPAPVIAMMKKMGYDPDLLTK